MNVCVFISMCRVLIYKVQPRSPDGVDEGDREINYLV